MAFNRIMSLSVLLALALSPRAGSAQTWDEFFSQKEKQREYDKAGVTALSFNWVRTVYIRNAIKYGLETYMNVSEGNFNLSRDFFGRLNNVNPGIASSARVIDIIMFQYYLTRDMGRVWNFCASGKNFTASEVRYIERVHSNFLVLTQENASELMKIIMPGEVQMTDEERLGQLDRIYESMCDQQAFVKSFGDDVYQLSRERQKEQSSLEYSRQLYTTY